MFCKKKSHALFARRIACNISWYSGVQHIVKIESLYFFLCLWGVGNCILQMLSIPKICPFSWSEFWDSHSAYHLSVTVVGPYQQGCNQGKTVTHPQCESLLSGLFVSAVNPRFCLHSCGTMTSRKKVLLKVIILGDSGWVIKAKEDYLS